MLPVHKSIVFDNTTEKRKKKKKKKNGESLMNIRLESARCISRLRERQVDTRKGRQGGREKERAMFRNLRDMFSCERGKEVKLHVQAWNGGGQKRESVSGIWGNWEG